FRSGDPKYSLIAYRHPKTGFKADFNILAGYEYTQLEEDNYGFLYKGWRISAQAGERLHLNANWYNGAFRGDLDAAQESPLIDGYYKRKASHIQLDNMTGELGYHHPSYTLALGRGRFQLGNTISSSIILSDQINDYAYLLAEGRAGSFTLSFLHGSLRADSTYNIYDNPSLNAKNYPDKYIALHQLNYTPNPIIDIFAGETVVYGHRSIDLNYLLPNSFWRAVEHNQGDRDNVLLYAGMNLSPTANLLLYAQAALDEFSYGKIFSNWWGNKYALQGGASFTATDLALPQSPAPRITLEATAVRPFTYTHYLNHSMYSHDGRALGYAKGSNLLNLSLALNLAYRNYLSWDANLAWCRQGSFGSDWRQNYHDVFPGNLIDSGTAEWFEGERSDTISLHNTFRIPIMAHHRLIFGHNSEHTDTWQHRYFAGWQLVY
ncbi:MAG TPA: hypothetical protein PKI59_07285, partial [Candidatus Cloacimonadota bacterium]|nr:hypothetical protein [Candidatus Cloacimonadota bacterium]